jgi:hypothetical protein
VPISYLYDQALAKVIEDQSNRKATGSEEEPTVTPKKDGAAYEPVPQKQDEPSTHSWRWPSHRFLNTSSTVAIAAFTGVLIFTSIFQWCVMQGQLDEMISSGKQVTEAVGELKKLATSMEASVAQSQNVLTHDINTSRLDQRAWLGIKQYRMRELGGGKLVAEVAVDNVGKTPARRVAGRVAMIQFSQPISIERSAKSAHFLTRKLPVMFPNSHFFVTYEETASEPEIEAIKTGTRKVYLFGDISYIDAFNVHHFTQFCGLYNPATKDFDLCEEFNDAD